jgi:hypothetical protein
MTLSIEIRGATHGFLEYARWYFGLLTAIGAHPLKVAANVPAPIVLSRLRRSWLLRCGIEFTPPEELSSLD